MYKLVFCNSKTTTIFISFSSCANFRILCQQILNCYLFFLLDVVHIKQSIVMNSPNQWVIIYSGVNNREKEIDSNHSDKPESFSYESSAFSFQDWVCSSFHRTISKILRSYKLCMWTKVCVSRAERNFFLVKRNFGQKIDRIRKLFDHDSDKNHSQIDHLFWYQLLQSV